MSIEEKTNEIVEFLRPRIEEGLFLYAYQADGKIDLKNVREKVYEELALLEKNLEDRADSEKVFEDAGKNIAFHINMSLDAAFLSTKKEGRTFFLPSFLSYAPEISEKLMEIEKRIAAPISNI